MRLFLLLIAILVIIGVMAFFLRDKEEVSVEVEEEAHSVEEIPVLATIGKSVQGRKIESYTYGEGSETLLFIGGIHGGYEWNSSLLSYELIEYIESNLEKIPNNLKIVVIPSANPDGLYEVIAKEGVFSSDDVSDEELPIGTGRFNANGVDLNRNFDCKWKEESMWRGNVVSSGSEAFSEPEARVIRDFVNETKPIAVVFFHSQANTVYASECMDGIIPETIEIMNLYADSAEYNRVEKFDAYEVTGDSEGWLASIGIPAITVELENHTDTDFERNRAGIEALFEYYSK